jgi:2-keto-4-pentenoate hydratase/2-oxohepta-3-ene-1,7-dioic acid hydratase in catechol pathway
MQRFVRVEYEGRAFWGEITDDRVVELDQPCWLSPSPTGPAIPLADVKYLCPVQPTKIILVGLNYRAHVSHSQSATEAPQNPVLFMKPPSSLLPANGQIVYPDGVDRVDYEAELAVVMGRRGRRIPPDEVPNHILGYTCLNDVTARRIQKQDGQWTRGKGYDTFCPIGPEVVTGIDPSDLLVEAYLNGERKQSGRTSQMIFPVPELVSFISDVMTLEPGDVISTGTPEGIDPMQRGDTIEVRIEKVGSLVNTVV